MKKERTFKKAKRHTPKTGRDHHEDMVANLRDWSRREVELLRHDLPDDDETKVTLDSLWSGLDDIFFKLQRQVERVPVSKVEPPARAG